MTTPDTGSNPSRLEILARVREIAAQREDCPLEQVLPESDLEHDLGMDSLARVEFAMDIEMAFDIELEDELADQIKTVGQAVEAVTAQLASRTRPG